MKFRKLKQTKMRTNYNKIITEKKFQTSIILVYYLVRIYGIAIVI